VLARAALAHVVAHVVSPDTTARPTVKRGRGSLWGPATVPSVRFAAVRLAGNRDGSQRVTLGPRQRHAKMSP
jgi:hypothetical protein